MLKILFSLILTILMVSQGHAVTPLKPSLTTQMQRQESINTKNTISEKRQANKNRLATIKAQRDHTRLAARPLTNIKTEERPVVLVSSPTNSPNKNISSQLPAYSETIKNVDMDLVRSTWIEWNNSIRRDLGERADYIHDTRLDSTAHDWNQVFMAGK
jgi:hypothetical protein